MKKALFFLGIAAVMSLASCKKDYVCECTFSSNGYTSTDQTNLLGVSKGAAKANCQSTSSTYTITGGTSVTTTNTCKLK